MEIEFVGATQEVTGSCHLVRVGGHQILLDTGLIQGGPKDEARNRELFPFDPRHIDAVILSHAHIAGSGMCNGGRIKHHLKHNVWRRDCHIIIVGFQARGTIGRALVDGARHIRLWGETIRVNARVHTIGGLSAHADQDGLTHWYSHLRNRPPLVLVHGEAKAMDTLASRLRTELQAPVELARLGKVVDLRALPRLSMQ